MAAWPMAQEQGNRMIPACGLQSLGGFASAGVTFLVLLFPLARETAAKRRWFSMSETAGAADTKADTEADTEADNIKVYRCTSVF